MTIGIAGVRRIDHATGTLEHKQLALPRSRRAIVLVLVCPIAFSCLPLLCSV